MNLPVLAVVSFFLTGCAASTAGTYTSVEPEKKCQIWMSYHSEFVSGIRNSSSAAELFSKEQEAREVRLGFADEIKHSGMNSSARVEWTRKLEIGRGEAIIAATGREEALTKAMLEKIDSLCQESSRLSSFFISQNDNEVLDEVLSKMGSISRQMEELLSECMLLGIEKEHKNVCESIVNDLREIMRAKQQRVNAILGVYLLSPRFFFFFFTI
jgi:hypothetical protein